MSTSAYIFIAILTIGVLAAMLLPRGSTAKLIIILCVYVAALVIGFITSDTLRPMILIFGLPLLGVLTSLTLLKGTITGKVILIISICWIVLSFVFSSQIIDIIL